MATEKCFCHFNGYEVKDAKARKDIETLNNSVLDATNDTRNNASDISRLQSALNNEVFTLKGEDSKLRQSINTNAENIALINENVSNNANAISDLSTSISDLNSIVDNAHQTAMSKISKVESDVERLDGINESKTTDINTLKARLDVVESLDGTEEVLFEGKLLGSITKELDTSPYKRLLITFCMYDSGDANTGGCSNITMLDLTNPGSSTNYTGGMSVPYIVNGARQGDMWIRCIVNTDKTTIAGYLGYNSTSYNNVDNCYISKIVGIR